MRFLSVLFVLILARPAISITPVTPVSVVNGTLSTTVNGTLASAIEPKTSTFTGTAASVTDIISSTDVKDYATVQLQSTGLSGTVQVQFSQDESNWVAGMCFNSGNAGTAAGAVINIITNNIWTCPVQGRYMRIRKTVHSSGTVTITGFFSSIAFSPFFHYVMSAQSGNYTVRAQDGSGNALTSTNGRLNISAGTMEVSNQITGFATEATLGSVLTATTSGTVNVLAQKERLYDSITVLAGSDGTLVVDIADGYAGLKINLSSSDFTNSDVTWSVSHDGTNYVGLSCLNIDALDGQFLNGIGYWRDALYNVTDFACNVGGYRKLKLLIANATSVEDLTAHVSFSKQPNLLFGIAGNVFTVDYQWRTVGGDGYTPGPDGNAPTLANSKPIINVKIPLTANSPLRGTVGTSSAEHIAENADRKGLVISNDSANKIYLAFGTTAVSGYGIVVPAGGQFKMDAYSFSTQAVHAIATGTLSIMPYQEFQ